MLKHRCKMHCKCLPTLLMLPSMSNVCTKHAALNLSSWAEFRSEMLGGGDCFAANQCEDVFFKDVAHALNVALRLEGH